MCGKVIKMTNENSNSDSGNQPTESLQASDEMPEHFIQDGSPMDQALSIDAGADNVQPSLETAHPDIRDGSVSSRNPLKNFMKKVQQRYNDVPQAWGQMRTNSPRKENR